MRKETIEKIYKIYNLAQMMVGYCENADGKKVFAECLIDSLKDIRDFSLDVMEEI